MKSKSKVTSVSIQGADHANGSGNTNPSYQDSDKNTSSSKKTLKATAHMDSMNYDGGLNTMYGK